MRQAESSSHRRCPDLSFLMLFLSVADTRWISQQSKSEVPIKVCLRQAGKVRRHQEAQLFEYHHFLFLFHVFQSERRTHKHLKHPQYCELHEVPQRDGDGVY